MFFLLLFLLVIIVAVYIIMCKKKHNLAVILYRCFKGKQLITIFFCVFSLNKEFLMVPYQTENLYLIYC